MYAILTQYRGPTNTRGSRISAKVRWSGHQNYRLTTPYQHDLSAVQNHARAAQMLAERMGLDGTRWHAGDVENGYVFVAEMGEGAAFEIERDTNR